MKSNADVVLASINYRPFVTVYVFHMINGKAQ